MSAVRPAQTVPKCLFKTVSEWVSANAGALTRKTRWQSPRRPREQGCVPWGSACRSLEPPPRWCGKCGSVRMSGRSGWLRLSDRPYYLRVRSRSACAAVAYAERGGLRRTPLTYGPCTFVGATSLGLTLFPRAQPFTEGQEGRAYGPHSDSRTIEPLSARAPPCAIPECVTR